MPDEPISVRRSSGVALVSVLLVLSVLVVLAAYIAEDQHLAMRRVGNQHDREQAYEIAVGAEQWVAQVFGRIEVDQLGVALTRRHALLPEIEVEHGTVAVSVQDPQARFNLNNLRAGRDDIWYPAFVRLLRELEIDEALADAVVDWIDEDLDVDGPSGAEDPTYVRLKPPLRTANRIIHDLGELVWVTGIDSEIIEQLSPYVTTLPAENVRLNVNSAPEVLMRVLADPSLSETSSESLVRGRGESGYASARDFLARSELAGHGDVAAALATTSTQYIDVSVDVTYGRARQAFRSLLVRTDDGISVISRKWGLR